MPKTQFQSKLMDWYERHKRDLPWRNINDPYRIWLSEVILQQTRVAQGLPYYQRFIKNYPSVQQLAEADEDQVLKDWEGLGYYSRARNLHAAAKQVAFENGGEFPQNHEEILKLKGVGDYTAAAISSFAYNHPQAVVDGNVFRVLARFHGIDTPINSTAGKKQFAQLAAKMLDQEKPGLYNQAIMEFGALQCVPKNPDCAACPFKDDCKALAQGRVSELPVKVRKKYDRQRYFNYALVNCGNEIYLEQRKEKDIWNKLFQLYLVEAPDLLITESMLEELLQPEPEGGTTIRDIHLLKPHKLSHQSIHIKIFELELAEKAALTGGDRGFWVPRGQLQQFAFPRPLRHFLDRKQLTLRLE